MSRDGKFTGGRPFPKGNNLNPKGRPKVPEEVKESRKLTQVEFDKASGKLLFTTQERLKEIIEDPNTNVLEALVGKVLLKGIQDSNFAYLNHFLERSIGKIAEHHNFTGNLNTGLVQLLEELKKQKELNHGEENFKEVEELEKDV